MKQKVIIIFIILLVINCSGCSSSDQQQAQKKDNQLPTSLVNIELTIQRIVDNLETIYNKQQEKAKADSKSEPEEEDLEEWKKINEDIEKLHYNWNQYKSQSSLSAKKLEPINQELDKLIEDTEQHNLLLSMLNISKFHLRLAKIYMVYNQKEGKIKESEGQVRNIIYLTRAKEKSKKRQSYVNELRNSIKQLQEQTEDSQTIKELKAAANDLERAVKNHNDKVVEVEGQLILDKLQAMNKDKEK